MHTHTHSHTRTHTIMMLMTREHIKTDSDNVNYAYAVQFVVAFYHSHFLAEKWRSCCPGRATGREGGSRGTVRDRVLRVADGIYVTCVCPAIN